MQLEPEPDNYKELGNTIFVEFFRISISLSLMVRPLSACAFLRKINKATKTYSNKLLVIFL